MRTRVSEGRYCPLSGWEQVQGPTSGEEEPLGLSDPLSDPLSEPSTDAPIGSAMAECGPLPGFDPERDAVRWGSRSTVGSSGGVGLCVDCWTWHGGACEGALHDAPSSVPRAA